MSIHEEKILPGWAVVLILTAAFLLIYPLWKLGLRDLFWDEGEYAAIIMELNSFPPDTRAHGELIPGFYPLYPLLVKGLVMAGLSMEFSLRFISVAALAGLTVMTGVIGFHMAGIQAGAAAASIAFTTLITAEKAVEGYPDTLLVLLIFSGWLLWFYLGRIGGYCTIGWITTGLFAGLTFYCGGWSALIYFLAPMMFLKRPFTLWRRLNSAGFPAGVLILAVFILIWLVPRWTPDASKVSLFSDYFAVRGYFGHFFNMAADIAFRLLPWTFFLYAPFCPALIGIDRNPLFSKYLRTLFTISALIIILNPQSRARDILYLVPEFALMAGLNYEIVTRRHGQSMYRILRWCALIAFIVCISVLLYEMIPPAYLKKIPLPASFNPGAGLNMITSSCLLEAVAGGLIASAAYLLTYRKASVWLVTVMIFTSGMLCFYALSTPRRAAQRSRSEMGAAFRQALGKSYSRGMTVYKDNAISGLYPECYYLGTRICTIPFSGTGSLKEKEVYLLSVSSIQPQDSARTWTKIMDVIYKKQNLYMWKGILNDRQDGPDNDIRNIRF